MSTTHHLHCAECHEPIDTVDDAGQPIEIATGLQFRPMPGPNGQVALVPVKVPLCGTCLERIREAEEARKLASRLIVPGVMPSVDVGRSN